MTTLPPPESFDVLSAYLDGELTPAEATEVRELLERSPEHRAELDRVEQARTWLRALPPVEPPEGFIEQAIAVANRPVAEPKKRKWGMLNLVATAAVWVAVLGFVNMSRSNDVSPDAANLAQTHTEASAGFGGLLGSLGAGRPEQQAAPQAELGEPYWAPLTLPGDLGLRQVQISDNLVGLVYCNDADLVMLYEEPGVLDPNAISGARPISAAGTEGWLLQTDTSRVVIVQRDDIVYAVAGPPRWSARRCGRRAASRATVAVAHGSTRRRRSRTARLVRPRLSPRPGSTRTRKYPVTRTGYSGACGRFRRG